MLNKIYIDSFVEDMCNYYKLDNYIEWQNIYLDLKAVHVHNPNEELNVLMKEEVMMARKLKLEKIQQILIQYDEYTPENIEDKIKDILTDIMHYCNNSGINFEKLYKLAQKNYYKER